MHGPHPAEMLLWEKPEGLFLETPSGAVWGQWKGHFTEHVTRDGGCAAQERGVLCGLGVIPTASRPACKADLAQSNSATFLLNCCSEPTACGAQTLTGLV